MCRSTDYHGFPSNNQDRLKIRAFLVKFRGLNSRTPLPQSLTLVYLTRINENVLEIDGSKIRPDSPAVVTLHRAVNVKTSCGEAVFGSRERVAASEGLRFEVYLEEERVLKGVFRRDEEEGWRLECRCVLEKEVAGVEVSAADVCVVVEGHAAMTEKVPMVIRRRRHGREFLEEIPEEREVGESEDCDCDCDCGAGEIGFDGGDLRRDFDGQDDGEEFVMDMDGVKWALDVGIWVMCLGVGFLVSKASAKTLRRRKLL
ncbi:hypothetical protein UlMin_043852 [Ulmus minor]